MFKKKEKEREKEKKQTIIPSYNQNQNQNQNKHENENENEIENIIPESKIKTLKSTKIKINPHVYPNSNSNINEEDLTNLIKTNKNKEDNISNNNYIEEKNQNKNKNHYFKNNLNYDINIKGFLIRFIIISVGLCIIGYNSYTNCLITDQESEGIKDKLIEFLSFYTFFLQNNFILYGKFISFSIIIFYDIFILIGILLWIIKGKNSKMVYTLILFFSLMFLMQNIFYMEMPLYKDPEYNAYFINVNSLFINFPINKLGYYSGQVGFLLIIIMEFIEHELISLSIFGLIYLINLIAYLLAIHHSNTLSIISSIGSALYFEKISSEFIKNRFNILEFLSKRIKKFIRKNKNKEDYIYKGDSNNNNYEKNQNQNQKQNKCKLKENSEDEYEKLYNNDTCNYNDSNSKIIKKNVILNSNTNSVNNYNNYNLIDNKYNNSYYDNDNENQNEIMKKDKDSEKYDKIGNENYLNENDLEFLNLNKQKNNPKKRIKTYRN
jgi:hypothetical protein